MARVTLRDVRKDNSTRPGQKVVILPFTHDSVKWEAIQASHISRCLLFGVPGHSPVNVTCQSVRQEFPLANCQIHLLF